MEENCSCYCHQAKNGESWSGVGCIHCKGYEVGTTTQQATTQPEKSIYSEYDFLIVENNNETRAKKKRLTNWGVVIVDIALLIVSAITGNFWILLLCLLTGEYTLNE